MAHRMVFSLWLVLFLVSVSPAILAAWAADDPEGAVPEFFGVYIKTKSGSLVELRAEKAFQYKAFELAKGKKTARNSDLFNALNASSRPPNWYFAGKPTIQVSASDIAGFYVYGDFDLTSFFVTQFEPSVLGSDVIVFGDSDTGPGIKKPGNHVDGEHGWSIEKAFRYVEEKPKLYWVVPRENTNLGESDASFLAVTFEDGQYYPFSLAQEELEGGVDGALDAHPVIERVPHDAVAGEDIDYDSLWDESKRLREEGKLEEALIVAKQALGGKVSAEDELVYRFCLYQIAECSFLLGKREEAAAVLTPAMQQYPDDLNLVRIACALANEAEDFETCIRYSTTIIDKHDRFAKAHNSLAWAYVRTGQNLDEAIAHAKKASKLADSDSEKAAALHTVGEAYALKGDLKSAMHWCQQGLKCDGKSVALLQQKAKIEFLEKEKKMKNNGRSSAASSEKIAALLSGTWLASLKHESENPRFRQTDVRLVVKSSTDLENITADYSFKLPGDSDWGPSFEMSGRANIEMGRVMLLAVKKTRNVGLPWQMVDLFGEISEESNSVKWTQYGTEGEFRKEE